MGYDLLEKGQFQPALDIFQQSLLRISILNSESPLILKLDSSSNVPDSLDSLTKQQLISCVNYKAFIFRHLSLTFLDFASIASQNETIRTRSTKSWSLYSYSS